MSSQITRNLAQRQLGSGGWSYAGSKQASIEATCLSALGLSQADQGKTALAVRFLMSSQPGAGSWVIPTAFSVVAIKQFTVCNRLEASEKRIRLGVEMLLDRACVGGRWKSGNSVVYEVPLRPHVEAIAIALLALQDEPRGETVQASVKWLESEAADIKAV